MPNHSAEEDAGERAVVETPPAHDAARAGGAASGGARRRVHQQAVVAAFCLDALRGGGGGGDAEGAAQALLDAAARAVADGLGCGLSKAAQHLPARGALLLRAGVGWRPGLVGSHEAPCDADTAAGHSWHARAPVVSNADPGRTRFRVPATMREHGVRRAVNVPIPAAEGGPGAAPFGVLEADSRDAGAFSRDDIAFLQALANALSVALGRDAARRDSERLLAEALEARRLRERARLWDASPDLIVGLEPPDGRIAEANPAWEARLGRPPGALVGRRFAELVHPGDLPALAAAARGLRAGRPVCDRPVELRLRRHTGDSGGEGDGRVAADAPEAWRWFAWTAAAEGPEGDGAGGGGGGGAAGRVYATGRDTTAEREAREALRRATEELHHAQRLEAVGQLTGGVAHDVNNMLQGIGGALEMLERRVAAGRLADLPPLFRAAREGVARAAALAHGLLAFARRGRLEPRPVVVDDVVRGMAELVRRTAGPAVDVRLRLGDGSWTVHLDPARLESALLNLAINARDAMAPAGGGALTFATEEVALSAADLAAAGPDAAGVSPGDFVRVTVSDTGPGMAPEVLARAFEPFFTTKPLGAGTGLGLSQVHGFVRQSGGLARIEGAPGRGAAIHLLLPRGGTATAEPGAAGEARTATARAAAVPPAGGTGEGTGRTALLVDDEPAVRALAAEALRESGFRVLEAGDGPSALRALAEAVAPGGAGVDVLVTDVGLPGGLNGRQVAEAARERLPALPVLFVSGYAGTALDGALPAGMAAIPKPVALDDLAARVAALLDGREGGR